MKKVKKMRFRRVAQNSVGGLSCIIVLYYCLVLLSCIIALYYCLAWVSSCWQKLVGEQACNAGFVSSIDRGSARQLAPWTEISASRLHLSWGWDAPGASAFLEEFGCEEVFLLSPLPEMIDTN